MEIIERKSDVSPLVSVAVLVYNHEKYIRKALDSILMQEVDFDYEIVIAEDCSTDNSREIIFEYYNNYPHIFKLILQEKNVGMRLNSDDLRHNCSGKYRATLEGDDYWIVSDKLKKQVDFLEKNEDYIAIGGDFICIDEKEMRCKFPWGNIIYTYCQDEEYTLEHVNKWLLPAHASAMLFRNVFKTSSPEMLQRFEETMLLGDRRTTLFLVLQGKIKHVKEVMFVRRVLINSENSMTGVTKRTNWHYRNYLWLVEAEKFAKDAFNVILDLDAHKLMRWKSALKLYFLKPNKTNYEVMKNIYNICGEKRRYRKYAKELISTKLKKTIREKHFSGMLKEGIKFVGRFAKNLFKPKTQNTKMDNVANSFVK